MKLLFLVFTLYIFYHRTVADLTCYYCIASLSSDCAKGDKNAMVIVPCRARSTVHSHSKGFDKDLQFLNNDETVNDSALKASCVKFVEPLPGSNKVYVRGCAVLPEDVDPCSYIVHNLNGTQCTSCETSLCNA